MIPKVDFLNINRSQSQPISRPSQVTNSDMDKNIFSNQNQNLMLGGNKVDTFSINKGQSQPVQSLGFEGSVKAAEKNDNFFLKNENANYAGLGPNAPDQLRKISKDRETITNTLCIA